MNTLNPTSAFKPAKNLHKTKSQLINSPFDFKSYLKNLENTLETIRLEVNKEASQQYLNQESIKVRYSVADELSKREEALAHSEKRNDKMAEIVSEYEKYVSSEITIKPVLSPALNEPDYSLLKVCPVYEYEAELGLDLEKKIEMMKKVVRFLRTKNIYVVFTKTLKDSEVNNKKSEYIELTDVGERDLPIGELAGNVIYINPWNVDFMSCFLTVGHLYGHMIQEMHIEEIKGIREFLYYPKPLDLGLVQKRYQDRYNRSDYKTDFKFFEEEAFAYAKYTFIEAGINWDENIEHAMRVYIETDFDELWRWATQLPEKEASSFNELYNEYYGKYKGRFEPLCAKEYTGPIVPNNEENIRVVRDGEL